jgi:hypothetical protein
MTEMLKRQSRQKWLPPSFLLCILIVSTGLSAFGQGTSGAITGIVKDSSGAVVPGVTVAVRNLETNATRSTISEENGRYDIQGLPSGPYELTAEVTGFTKYVRSPINLLLNQVAVVNPELRPSAVAETVTVTGDAPLLNTSTSEVGVRFDEKRISDLPTSGQFNFGGGFRDVFAYALSAPGVSQLNAGNSVFAGGTNFSSNGMRPRGNNFMVDGQDSNDPSVTGRQQVMNNPDMIKEFRLVTNQFLAEHGRAAGSIVNVVTKNGTNDVHGSAFWFNNNNQLNSLSNLDKAAKNTEAPFLVENQFGGTAGGPFWKDHTFWFGSLQRWTIRQFQSGTTISGIPTEAGRQTIQQLAGGRPQVQALLKFLPAASTPLGTTAPLTVGGQSAQIPLGSLTNAAPFVFNNWQWSGRVDHNFQRHTLGGRFIFNDTFQDGTGQATPPGLTQLNTQRQQAMSLFMTSTFTPRVLNEVRVSWQRLGNTTNATDTSSESIPSIEVTELGLTGFNAAASRTAIGLAVNLPQYRFNNTYQLQDTVSWMSGNHSVKFGIDFRMIDVKSFFFPTIRGLLRYTTLQDFVNDTAEAVNINLPLPGGETINYYDWNDWYYFVQDTWRVSPSFTLNLGLRYERPGNAMTSLFDLNDSIVQANGGNAVFQLTPRPADDKNNFQPRFGFSWNPQTDASGWLGWLTGGDKLVMRGGYARTNDYQFINLALNVASSFPYVAAIGQSNLPNAFAVLPTLRPDLSSPPALNLLNRTVLAEDFRSPVAEQFTMEIQRQMALNTVFRVGYVGTRGTGLFQTLDGNPRTICATPPNCPRVDPTRGTIRLRANASSSTYHSMQVSADRRFAAGVSGGAHYTWSSFIDDASDTFNPSARGEVAVSQDSFNRRGDRGRSTYDRPHRFATNFVYELPFYQTQSGVTGHILGGWQVSSSLTFQSGSPFSPLNGSDPAGALAGIDTLVGNAIRPNLNTNLDVSAMSPEELFLAGGRSLFQTITAAQRVGNVGRNVLRSDGISNIDLSILKSTRITESHQLQFRLDMFNMTNTRNFGIPEARINNAGFGKQWDTDGGNRRIFFSLRYAF